MKIKINKIAFFVVLIFQFFIIIFILIEAKVIHGSPKIVKLKADLYDPYDFMKGRYINLYFDIENEVFTNLNSIKNYSTEELNKKKRYPIYCILEKGDDDFHHIVDVSFDKPDSEKIFIKARIKYAYSKKIILKINFREYYLQEDYALKAEEILRNLNKKEFVPNLILAVDKNGKTVQKGFFINDIPIEKFILDNIQK